MVLNCHQVSTQKILDIYLKNGATLFLFNFSFTRFRYLPKVPFSPPHAVGVCFIPFGAVCDSISSIHYNEFTGANGGITLEINAMICIPGISNVF